MSMLKNSELIKACLIGENVAESNHHYSLLSLGSLASFSENQRLISILVILTIDNSTASSMNVGEPSPAYTYPVSGKLYNGASVAGKWILIKVNGTEIGYVKTASDGTYSLTLKLKPVNNTATNYQLEATFYGGNALNPTLYGVAPDSSRYALCTTLQYFGYKPSTATATLTVEPQSTELLKADKTPEQLQKEAQQNGWLTTWHEFTWWYPWYRIHFIFKYGGTEMFDQRISPLPFGSTISCSVATAEFTALLASNAGPAGFVAALLVSIGIKLGSLYTNWNSIGGLAGAFIGNVFSTVMGMLKWTWSFVADFLKLLMGIINFAEFGFGNLYRIFSFPTNIAYLGTILTRLHSLGAIP